MVCPNACDECKTHDYSTECVPALQNVVQAQQDVIREQDEMLKMLQKQREERKSGKLYTLEEIAHTICNSYDEKGCDVCPATQYCYRGHTGTLEWLRKVIENEQD